MTDRIERLINLVIALRETRRPLTAEDVRVRVAGYGQDDHEAFRRMFERDKADLRALGVPVETAALDRWDDRQGYRIDPARYDLPAVDLAPDELAALALAAEVTGLGDQARTALIKLGVDAGDPATSARPRDIGLGVHLDAPHRAALMEAQLRRRTVRFTYVRPGDAAAERTVDPHALVHRRGRWYLVGQDHDRGATRAFRLDRIAGTVSALTDADAFQTPAEPVDVDAVVPQRAGIEPLIATVAATPAVAWQVARRARGGGRPGPDGTTVYRVSGADADDLVGWVLEFGPDAEVLGPPDLRRRATERLRAAAGAS